ncbi:MAG: TssN family type VI secretion system protein [Bacteroidota bacterium]
MKAPVLGIALFGVVLAILVLLTGMWLFKSQKKNRKFDKKVTRWYVFIVFILFVLVGLWGLHPQDILFFVFLAVQSSFLILGILHVWILFSYFEWPDRAQFKGETFVTLYTFLSGLLGFVLSFKLLDYFAGPNRGLEFWYIQGSVWFLLPYMMLRTFDLVMLIPRKRYYTWRFVKGCSPQFDLSDSNIFRISIALGRRYDSGKEGLIVQTPRFPRDGAFGDFFLKFVSDYNKRHPGAPIENLTEDSQGNKIGWNFKVRKFSSRRRFLLDPKERASSVLGHEDTVYAIRVQLPADHPEPDPCPEPELGDEIEWLTQDQAFQNRNRGGSATPDDEIQFFE